MAYALHLWVAGETVTAANLNQVTYTNWQESAVGKAAAAGDIPYATAANALAVLSLGAGNAYKMLRGNAGGTAPAWSALLTGVQTATAATTAVTTGAYRDAVTVAITPTIASGMILVAGGFNVDCGGSPANIRGVIGAGNGPAGRIYQLAGGSTFFAAANATTSAVTCKIQGEPVSDNGNFTYCWIVAAWVG